MDSDHEHVCNIALYMRLDNQTTPNLYNQGFLIFSETRAFLHETRIAFNSIDKVFFRVYSAPNIFITSAQNSQEIHEKFFAHLQILIKGVTNDVVRQLTNCGYALHQYGHDFSAPKKTPMSDAAIKALIGQGVADVLPDYEANRGSGNGHDNHDS
ncbi:hypothetical protein Tco_1327638 [Tanacetum coccineum]